MRLPLGTLTAETTATAPADPIAQARERQEGKDRYHAYQGKAREQAEAVNRVLDRTLVSVQAHPTVWAGEDGAFVEAVIWVPREDLG